MTLHEMAREYRSNTALLELRLRQLQVAQRRARQKEVKYRLKQRIGCLRVLEHYYQKGGRQNEDKRAV